MDDSRHGVIRRITDASQGRASHRCPMIIKLAKPAQVRLRRYPALLLVAALFLAFNQPAQSQEVSEKPAVSVVPATPAPSPTPQAQATQAPPNTKNHTAVIVVAAVVVVVVVSTALSVLANAQALRGLTVRRVRPQSHPLTPQL
jgi:hypothetical protein